jgi:translocation and assembly module TamB
MGAVSQALRTALGLVVGTIVLVLLLAAGLWWWSGTEGSLDWTLRQLARRFPITAEGVTGSLREGLRVQKLVWDKDGLRVEVREAHLEWKVHALARRTLQLDEVQAAAVIVTDRRAPTGEPLKPPRSTDLPLRVELDKFAIGRAEYNGATTLQASEIAGRYAFRGLAHELRLDKLRWAKGVYSGRIQLGAVGEMKLQAQLRGALAAPVPGAADPLPIEFTAEANGPLRLLDVQARLRGEAPKPQQAPRATVSARVAPFDAQPLPQASAQLQRVDVGAIWPQAPTTLLSGRIEVQPAGTATWKISADLENGAPGPWDKERLPAKSLRGSGEWRNGTAFVRELVAAVASGEIEAKGQWRAGAWTVDATLDGVDPAALYSPLAPMVVNGKAHAQQKGKAIAFDVDLKGQPRAARASDRKDKDKEEPAAASQALAALQLQELVARGEWSGQTVALANLRARASDALLQGNLTADIEARSGRGKLTLAAPGLNATADGEISARRGGGKLIVLAPDLARAQQWLRRVPWAPDALTRTPLSGQARSALAWQGGWEDPAVLGTVDAPQLQWGSGPQAWSVRDVLATVSGRLRDAQLQLRAQAQQGARSVQAVLSARGGRLPSGEWRASFSELRAALRDPALGAGERPWELQARRPFDARWVNNVLTVSAGEAALSAPAGGGGTAPAVLSWSPIRWGGGELQTAGRVSGLPMAWITLFGGPQLAGSALAGDMVFDAQWDASLGRTPRIDATLRRVSGDIDVLAENAEGLARRVRAGVRDASVRLQTQGERLLLSANWASERAGNAQAQIASRLVRGGGAGWQWPEQAPLEGRIRAELPRIGIWSLLAPPGWRLRGTLGADVRVAGTRAQPLLAGAIQADNLALRSVVDGIELRDGRLRARLDGDRLRVEQFVLRGAGTGEGGGLLSARGEGRWTAGGPELDATVQLAQLRASIRSDRLVTLSGQLAARVTPRGSEVNGRLTVDEALIVLPEEAAPRLGEDVVVRNAPGQIATAEERKRRPSDANPAADGRKERPLNVAVQVSLGDNFRVRGRGIDTRMAGTLDVAADSLRDPRLTGTVRSVGGRYRAYNQQLEIERGVLRFTGPPDNPALDVLAVRPRAEQRVGVLVTGRAQSPVIRLYSEPDLPDAQKLALLVTGRTSPAGGAETALVQQAAMALLAARAGGGRSGGGGIASRLGLDDLSVRRDAEGGALVALGKRFSENFYASFERSLSGGLGTLYVFYEISQRLKLRAETGGSSAVDLIFTFAW